MIWNQPRARLRQKTTKITLDKAVVINSICLSKEYRLCIHLTGAIIFLLFLSNFFFHLKWMVDRICERKKRNFRAETITNLKTFDYFMVIPNLDEFSRKTNVERKIYLIYSQIWWRIDSNWFIFLFRLSDRNVKRLRKFVVQSCWKSPFYR